MTNDFGAHFFSFWVFEFLRIKEQTNNNNNNNNSDDKMLFCSIFVCFSSVWLLWAGYLESPHLHLFFPFGIGTFCLSFFLEKEIRRRNSKNWERILENNWVGKADITQVFLLLDLPQSQCNNFWNVTLSLSLFRWCVFDGNGRWKGER